MTRRRIGPALALLAAVAVVVVIVLSTQSSSPAAASGGSHPNGAGTTTVQRRNLVQTDTESGTLTYANPQTVYNRLSGTITWLPTVGQLIRPGHALFKVDGEPVILMKGGTPAFRDLNGYDGPGPDILELNRNLVALGDNPDGIVVDDTWQPATTAGVDILQASLGQTETGDLTLGQIIFLPGPQLVSTLDTTVGSTGGGSGGSSPATGASDPVISAAPEFVSLTTPQGHGSQPQGSQPKGSQPKGTNPKRSKPPQQNPPGGSSSNPRSGLQSVISMLESEIAKLQAEIAAAKNGGGNGAGSAGSKNNSGGGSSGGGSSGGGSSGGGSSGGGSSGGGSSGGGSSGGGSSGGTSGGTASAILQTSSKQLVVTVDLDASKQSEAKLGEKVTVEMPSGQTVPGKIIGVSPVAQSSSSSGSGAGASSSAGGSGSSGSSTVPVTVQLTGRVRGAGLDQAAVSVNFVQAQAKHVLSVPVTALLATSGGGFALQEASAPHRLVPVRTGLFAAGYVQVSGPGVYPGLAVTDSEG